MKSSVFSYPYEQVFRRTQRSLSHWGLKLKSANAITGFIQAQSGFTFLRPSMKVDLVVQEMENHDTKVTVTGMTVKKGLFATKEIDAEFSEAELLTVLSTHF